MDKLFSYFIELPAAGLILDVLVNGKHIIRAGTEVQKLFMVIHLMKLLGKVQRSF